MAAILSKSLSLFLSFSLFLFLFFLTLFFLDYLRKRSNWVGRKQRVPHPNWFLPSPSLYPTLCLFLSSYFSLLLLNSSFSLSSPFLLFHFLGAVIAARYQIQQYIGSAAFSKAVQCLDLFTNELVCIKVFLKNFFLSFFFFLLTYFNLDY